VAVGAPLWTPLGSLQRPPESRPPVKHTSLHNRLYVLKCSKTHLQQTRISKIFLGTTPRNTATRSALGHNEQGRQLSKAGPDCFHQYKKCNSRSRNTRVIVESRMARFLAHSVHALISGDDSAVWTRRAWLPVPHTVRRPLPFRFVHHWCLCRPPESATAQHRRHLASFQRVRYGDAGRTGSSRWACSRHSESRGRTALDTAPTAEACAAGCRVGWRRTGETSPLENATSNTFDTINFGLSEAASDTAQGCIYS